MQKALTTDRMLTSNWANGRYDAHADAIASWRRVLSHTYSTPGDRTGITFECLVRRNLEEYRAHSHCYVNYIQLGLVFSAKRYLHYNRDVSTSTSCVDARISA